MRGAPPASRRSARKAPGASKPRDRQEEPQSRMRRSGARRVQRQAPRSDASRKLWGGCRRASRDRSCGGGRWAGRPWSAQHAGTHNRVGRRPDPAAADSMLIDDIRALLAAPSPDDSRPFLERLDATLTAGYAQALQLEAERWRIEQQIAEIIAGLAAQTDKRKTPGARCARAAADRCGRAHRVPADAARAAQRSARRAPRRCLARFGDPFRRSRNGPRKPRPGSGSRSGASSGCSRCGS